MKHSLLGIVLSSVIASAALHCSRDDEALPSLPPDASVIMDIDTGMTTTSTVPTYDVKSAEGIKVLLNGYSPDLTFLDTKFDAAADCLESRGYTISREEKKDALLVEIITDGRSFPCGSASPTGNCAGLFYPPSGARLYARIQLTQGLHAAAYESARHLTNDYEKEHSADVETCGDQVDHLLGHR